MKKTHFFAIGILTVSFLYAFFFYFTKTQKIPLKFAVSDWPGYGPAVYADVAGIYKKNGLNIEIVFVDGPIAANEKFEKGQVDGMAAVITDLIDLQNKGLHAQEVLLSDYSVSGDAIVGLSKYKSISDLKGKNISFESLNSFSQVFVLMMLEKYNLKETDVNFKMLSAGEVVKKLDSKEIDAGHTWDPMRQEALNKGYKVLGQAGDIPGCITDGMAFNQKVIEERPEDIKKFVKSFFEAQAAMLHDPEKSSLMVSRFFKNDPRVFAQSFSSVHFINLKENQTLLNENNPSNIYQVAKKINDFLVSRGQVADPDIYKKIITEKFINEIAP